MTTLKNQDEASLEEKKQKEPKITPFHIEATHTLPREYMQTLYKVGDRSASQIQIFLKQILRSYVRVKWIGITPKPFIEYIGKGTYFIFSMYINVGCQIPFLNPPGSLREPVQWPNKIFDCI